MREAAIERLAEIHYTRDRLDGKLRARRLSILAAGLIP